MAVVAAGDVWEKDEGGTGGTGAHAAQPGGGVGDGEEAAEDGVEGKEPVSLC